MKSQALSDKIYILLQEAFANHPHITKEDFEERAKYVLDRLSDE
jgi:hypothetical protein|tara:strand:- start:846 stop:977 length:132 start_codon:yes stop_codon:yes gene_type:complete